jgi:hypothetical protein
MSMELTTGVLELLFGKETLIEVPIETIEKIAPLVSEALE